MKKNLHSFIFILMIVCSYNGISQESGMYIPVNIQKAYQNQTRSQDGTPGIHYWQNRADYSIDIHFNPKTAFLQGRETITYSNLSPDTLHKLIFHLFPNIYKKNIARDFNVNNQDAGDGVTIEKIKIKGKEITLSPNNSLIEYTNTNMILYLTEPLLPDNTIKINITWNYTINRTSHNRTGAVDSTTYFIAYFFPRIAVYDDIDEWNDFEYTGTAEFYNDYGDFEVSIRVPPKFIVWATGLRENPEDVLTEKYLTRLKQAQGSDRIIHIVDRSEYNNNDITCTGDNLWKFKAHQVTDFAFATSDHYLWDATSIKVGPGTKRKVLVEVAYNKNSSDYYQVAKIARQSIEFMSHKIPGVHFPFPAITVFNGSDAMEYPMMVNARSSYSFYESVKLTSHEILHSYLPFFVGTNETKYAWMDEGFTTFGDYLICSHLVSPQQAGFFFQEAYRKQAGYALDTPIFTISQYLKRPVYTYNSYPKPAAFFLVLKDLLGLETFKKFLKTFMNNWKSKHPTPYDLFNTLKTVSKQNLNWLIRPWFYEFGYVDLALVNIEKKQNSYTINIEKKGAYPAPVELKIMYSDATTELIQKKASVWKKGNDLYTITLTPGKNITSLELIDKTLVDADLSNNSLSIK